MSHENKLRDAFKSIKAEFDEHLACINENTQEISTLNDQLLDFNKKFEKLNERINELFMMFEKQIKQQSSFLSNEEKQVFLALYSTEAPVSYQDIAKRTDISDTAAQYAVNNLLSKGVPIHKRFVNNRVYLMIDQSFKQIQAKLDVLNINQKQLVEFA